MTVWTIVTCTGTREEGNLALTGIEKVVYDSNEGQSFISTLGDSFYAAFAEQDERVAEGGYFTTTAGSDDIYNIASGASESSNAACNAVNTALACFRTVFMGGEA